MDNMVPDLLRDALALLNDHPNFSLCHDRNMTSYRLAARIEAYLRAITARSWIDGADQMVGHAHHR